MDWLWPGTCLGSITLKSSSSFLARAAQVESSQQSPSTPSRGKRCKNWIDGISGPLRCNITVVVTIVPAAVVLICNFLDQFMLDQKPSWLVKTPGQRLSCWSRPQISWDRPPWDQFWPLKSYKPFDWHRILQLWWRDSLEPYSIWNLRTSYWILTFTSAVT